MRNWTRMSFWDYLNYLGILVMACVMLYPFLYAFSVSVSSVEAVGAGQVILFPKGFDLGIYRDVFRTSLITQAYRNSIVYATLHTFFVLVFSLLGGYVLSEQRFRFRRPVSLILGLTLFFSAGLVPTFLVYNSYGLVDSLWVVTLPGAFSFWYIILVRTNIQAIPQDLKDSARIDGASDLNVLLQIVLPLTTAILATIALFAAVGNWNDYFGPLIYLRKTELRPLPIILYRLLVRSETKELFAGTYDPLFKLGYLQKAKMAAIMITTGPILLVYPFVQRYFVKGVLIGSIKG